MKILHVETGRHFLGGPQQVIYLIKALRERGYDNTLICPPGSGIDVIARADDIHVQNLSCAGDLDLPFAHRLSRLLREARPAIVHCHSRRGSDLLGGLAASLAAVPAVLSRRVDNVEMRITAALRYRPFRKVIAISAAIAAELRKRGVATERLVIIRDAVDAPAFATRPDCTAWRQSLGLTVYDYAIAAAGQLIPRKGHRFLLKAIAQLKDRLPQLRLVIFGAGELDSQLKAQAKALGLGEVVQFAGFREDLDTFLRCFDLFAHPALAEGLGVAVLKAAAAGLPVVAFAAGGLNEAVRDGETGLLVDAEDAPALAAAIERLANDRDLARRFGHAGRHRMQTEFSIDTMAEQHIAVYESVLNG